MKHRMNITHIWKTIELCRTHIGPLISTTNPHTRNFAYAGKGWRMAKDSDNNWFIEVDRKEDLVYISLLL